MTDEEIHQAGARARALGHSLHDNPFFVSDMVPRFTGVSLADWNWKCELWEKGWKMEDAFQSYQLRDDADGQSKIESPAKAGLMFSAQK